jgi:hypothetical protein
MLQNRLQPRPVMCPTDVTSLPSSDAGILKKIPFFLIDAIVVDVNFNIVTASQTVLNLLEFSMEEVQTKNINYFAGKEDLCSVVREDIVNGFFEEKRTSLFSKTNRCLNVAMSGFCFRLVSHEQSYFILKIAQRDAVEMAKQQRQNKNEDLDKFIYRTAHDLRGPLATIKGLINLIKNREDNSEIDRFMLLLDAHANKLDERLFNLVYVAQTHQEKEHVGSITDFNGIETNLRKIIEHNAFVDFLEFHFVAPEKKISEINYVLLSALLSNVLLYLLSLQMQTDQVQVFFRITIEEDYLKITIAAQGFETSESLRFAIHQDESIYINMVHYPQLLNFYGAQKIGEQLNARFDVHFLSTDKQRLSILLPFKK